MIRKEFHEIIVLSIRNLQGFGIQFLLMYITNMSTDACAHTICITVSIAMSPKHKITHGNENVTILNKLNYIRGRQGTT